MKERRDYYLIFMILVLTLFTPLAGEMGSPLPIGEEDDYIYFAGRKGLKFVAGTIHLSYMTNEDGKIMYARSESPYNHIDYQIVEPDLYDTILFSEPVIEVLSGGTVYIFYPRMEYHEGSYINALYKAEISPQGNLTDTVFLFPYIYSAPEIVNFDDNVHLLFGNGYEESIIRHQMFYDNSLALDDVSGNYRFTGADVIHGRLHSNTNIWIRQIGGGSNNGWPIFHDLVTTSGSILVFGGGSFHENVVFPGGLIEGYSLLELPSEAAYIRQNGMRPFGSIEDDDRIFFVTINGSTYESMVGTIIYNDPVPFVIYDTYPPYGPVGDSLGVNYISVPDTLWTVGPSGTIMSASSIWVPGELWISGMVSGKQTWGSSHNIYLKDDLIYSNTTPGNPPDGGDFNEPGFPQYPINRTDYLTLVSEKSILIQYGHFCPIENIRRKPNSQDIYIYGYLFALGEDDEEPNQYGIYPNAGIFSFQYQHPKGSTPSQYYEGQFYSNIDLHRYIYPTVSLDPWPSGLDYPWYNPLWPEPGVVFDVPVIPNPHEAPEVSYLRGTLNLFGGYASRRYGQVRRNGHMYFDTYNGIWHIEEGMFGRHAGQPTGYEKNHYFDKRLRSTFFRDAPGAVLQEGMETFNYHYWTQEAGEEDFSHVLSDTRSRFHDNLLLDANSHRTALLNGSILIIPDETGNLFQQYELEVSSTETIDIASSPEGVYLLERGRILLFDPLSEELLIIGNTGIYNRQQAISFDNGALIWAASINDEIIRFRVYDPSGVIINEYEWLHGIDRPDYLSWQKGKLALQAEDNNICVAVFDPFEFEGSGYGKLYVSTGVIDYQAVETTGKPEEILTVSHYPNPLIRDKNSRNLKLNISFALPEDSLVRLDLFNIRGQLVRTIIDNENYKQGTYIIQWDGLDYNRRPATRGVYFYKLETGRHKQAGKVLILN